MQFRVLQALSLLLFAAAARAQQDSSQPQDLGAGIGAALQVSKLVSDLLSSGDGKMIVSAMGDGSQCLDAGIWPEGCYDFTDPFCSSVGVWVWPTCTSSPWTFFQYNGKLHFPSGLRGLGRKLCVQAWSCADSSTSSSAIDAGSSSNSSGNVGSSSTRRLRSFVVDTGSSDGMQQPGPSVAGGDSPMAAAPGNAGPVAPSAQLATAAPSPLTPPAQAGSSPTLAPAAAQLAAAADDTALTTGPASPESDAASKDAAAGAAPVVLQASAVPAPAAVQAPAPANTTQSGDVDLVITLGEQQDSLQQQVPDSCDVRGAPCGWGGSHYMIFFSGDESGRTKSGFPLFRMHFANKGEGWCLTNTQTDAKVGSQAQLRPCDGSLAQLWFVPQW